MQIAEIKEIIECLPKGKTRFYYFKDRYALLLLRLAIDAQATKKELMRSKFGKLLSKQVVKESLGFCRGARISSHTFDAYWPSRYECYFLTLGLWGSNSRYRDQTTRRGYNLVLQLNFTSKHDEPYRKLIDPDEEFPFEYDGHPIASGSQRTLAWSRMDIDLCRGEALIEEIQTDWVRYALAARRRALNAKDTIQFYGTTMHRDRVIRYVDSVLRQHEEIWDEAMLSSTIHFLREELGIRSIYYHTYESGARLKHIHYRLPPRSIYSRLPKRFCFTDTDQRPEFLPAKARPARADPRLDNARFMLLEF